MSIHNGELLFIKSVKDGIPNRDPLNDSDARRIFPEEDGRISLSDVSIKRMYATLLLIYIRMEEEIILYLSSLLKTKRKIIRQKIVSYEDCRKCRERKKQKKI